MPKKQFSPLTAEQWAALGTVSAETLSAIRRQYRRLTSQFTEGSKETR